jgi:hypothetical protein
MHATIVEVEQSAGQSRRSTSALRLAVLHRLLGRHERPVADTLVVRSPW